MDNAVFSAEVLIDATAERVWIALTDPTWMVRWMGEPEMKLKVQTDWRVGSSIIVRGFHHGKFENRGLVLAFEKERLLCYSHLSSVSRLADVPENYSVLSFSVTPAGPQTRVELRIENFPTVAIQKHLEFYWRMTLQMFKEIAEVS